MKILTLSIMLFLGGHLSGCQAAAPIAESPAVSQNSTASDTDDQTADCTDFQRLIEKTYDFSPSKLNEAQQTGKSKEMDIVWEQVKGDQKRFVPCLIAALKAENANKFFLFDGSTLLYSLDKSEGTENLLIESYAKTDLADIMLQNWIAPILKLGLDGWDTSPAGDAWLRAKDPHYYLPQHGTLKVSRATGALAIYGSMDERFATPALAAIANQKDHPGREIAVDLLAQQVTPEAAEALKNVDLTTLKGPIKGKVEQFLTRPSFIQERGGAPKVTREQYVKAFKDIAAGNPRTFMQLTVEVQDGEKDAVVVLQPEDVPLVRKARRFFASTGTPHVPEWYQSFTDILMHMVWKPEIEKRKKQD